MKKFNRKRQGEERITMFQTCWGLVRRRLTSTSRHKPILPLCWYDCGLFPSAIRWLSVLLKWHWSCRRGHPVPFYGGLSGRDLLGRFPLLFLSPWWLVGWLGGPSWKFTPRGKKIQENPTMYESSQSLNSSLSFPPYQKSYCNVLLIRISCSFRIKKSLPNYFPHSHYRSPWLRNN